ncbi:MAG: hypothetical protein R3B70_21400 [Polyangiaceae bacterium]
MKEPDCSMGACTSSCGDGIKLPGGDEVRGRQHRAWRRLLPRLQGQARLHLRRRGDGPESSLHPPHRALRDFKIAHPDMETFLGTDKGALSLRCSAWTESRSTNAAGTTPTTSGKANFDQWYRDVMNVNFPVLQTIQPHQAPHRRIPLRRLHLLPPERHRLGQRGQRQQLPLHEARSATGLNTRAPSSSTSPATTTCSGSS